jgi:nicotinic acid mononucleotide adenylyltransferase
MPIPGDIAKSLSALDSTAGFGVVQFDDDVAVEPIDRMARRTGRVAVLPSAYNPPTLAHRHLLDSAARVDGVSASAALLSTRNVDKGVFGASLGDRIGMLLAEHSGPPQFAVLATNAARLADQGEALLQHFPGLAFDFVVGYDTLIRLFDARYYTDMPAELAAFFAHHRVIAANRAEATVVQVEEFVVREATAFAHRIVVHEIPPGPASLSSTHARSLSQAWEAAADEIVTQVVSPAVADYISEHGLYGAASPPQSRIANRES